MGTGRLSTSKPKVTSVVWVYEGKEKESWFLKSITPWYRYKAQLYGDRWKRVGWSVEYIIKHNSVVANGKESAGL